MLARSFDAQKGDKLSTKKDKIEYTFEMIKQVAEKAKGLQRKSDLKEQAAEILSLLNFLHRKNIVDMSAATDEAAKNEGMFGGYVEYLEVPEEKE